ncbi:MAG: asparagine synthetase B family protein [Acidimicrobiia bacterium]
MSGFVAVFGKGTGPAELAESMSRMIRHRGGRSGSISTAESAVVTLSHQNGAYEAMVSSNSERTVVFDGMLFNQAELLDAAGVDDIAEAIWRGFQEGGPGWFEELDGSFAIVIRDAATGRLSVARDRFGARPLLFGLVGSRVVMASEVKCLLVDDELPRLVDRDVLAEILRIGLNPGPATLLRGVFKALPGHLGSIDEGGYEPGELFSDYSPEVVEDRSSREFGERLEKSVIRTLEHYRDGGGRFGVQMSSGVDGALLAAYLADLAPGRAHGVSFGASNWVEEESGDAQEVALRLGIPFTRALVDEQFDVVADLKNVIWHMEEPTRFENAIALEVLGRAVSRSADVVVTGEGAGVYLGTGFHLYVNAVRRMWRIPAPIRRTAARLFRRLPSYTADRFARHLPGNSYNDYLRAYYTWTPSLAPSEASSPSYERIEQLETSLDHLSPVPQCSILESDAYQHLWIDRMEQTGAAYGLDVVHPFLRNEIARLSISSPTSLKVQRRGKITKPAVRDLAARYLGREFVDRPKKQLAAPTRLWLQTSQPLRAAVLSLRGTDSRWRAHLDSGPVEAMLDKFESDEALDRVTARGAHMLLSLEIWLRQFLHGDMRPPGPDRAGPDS